MRVSGCEECVRLWKKYTDTAFDFVKLDSKVKMASLQYESLGVMTRLREEVSVAARSRDVALERLKQHEITHQMRSAAAS